MTQRVETNVLTTLRDVLTSETRLSRRLARLAPTQKLARMLGRSEASLSETPFSSKGMLHGLSVYSSRPTDMLQECALRPEARP